MSDDFVEAPEVKGWAIGLGMGNALEFRLAADRTRGIGEVRFASYEDALLWATQLYRSVQESRPHE